VDQSDRPRPLRGGAWGPSFCVPPLSLPELGYIGILVSANYILDRLRLDSRHVLSLAAHEGAIGHPGVKGRFRELFLSNVLQPWLPASINCGTGLIIDHEQRVVEAGQEDIIIFDPLLGPAIFASAQSGDGVYLFDSALCRIEVKSSVSKADLDDFAATSAAVGAMELAVGPGVHPTVFGALNLMLGFTSEIAVGKEIEFLRGAIARQGAEPESGIVSGLCIADRGLWTLGETDGIRHWKELDIADAGDPLAFFVGFVSNSVFAQRAARLGLQPLGGGVGLYIGHPFTRV
jgi:hypothetical protein